MHPALKNINCCCKKLIDDNNNLCFHVSALETEQSPVADTLLPDAIANKIQEFTEERKKRVHVDSTFCDGEQKLVFTLYKSQSKYILLILFS